MVKKILVLVALLAIALPVKAQTVFKLNQLVSPLSAGFVYSDGVATHTQTASTSPFFDTFSFRLATGTSATTTNFFATTASTSNLFGALINGFNLSTCNGASSALTWSSGRFGCNTISAGSAASTTLLADNNTFSGTDTFSNTITGSVSGNAGTATILATGRTIAITGDLAYTSPSFNGSGNVTAAGTLATVNANTGSFGGVNSIPSFTVNGKGLITAAAANTPSIPASEITSGTFGTGDYTFPANLTVTSKLTATNASTTLFSTSYASSTQYFGAGLTSCNSASNAITWNAGVWGCNTISATGGSGTVSTSTNEVAGRVAYWTSNSGTPALLGQVATSSIANGTGITVTNGSTAFVLGSQPTINLDLTAQNVWTGASSTFVGGVTIGTSTTTSATSTNLFATTASTTNLFLATGLCSGANALNINSSGKVVCGAVSGSGSASTTLLSDNNTFTGQNVISYALGSVGAPSITFNGDTNNGIYSAAADSIDFTTNGVWRGGFDPAGRFAVGTNTPQWLTELATSSRPQLALSDASLTSDHWTLRSVGNNLYFATASPSTFATSSSAALSINTNGQITNPFVGSALVLSTNGAYGPYAGVTCTNQFLRALSATGASTCATVANTDLANSSVSYGGVSVSLGGSNATPAFNLASATGLPISTGVSGLGTGVATFLATPTSANFAAAVTGETGTGAVVFDTTPTFTTNLTVPLVIGGTGAASTLTLKSTSGSGTTDAIIFQVGNNGGTEAARFTTKGLLGIGTTTPTWALTVASTAPVFELDDSDGATDQKHLIQSYNSGIYRIGTSSDSTLTSTSSAFMSLDTTQARSFSFGSTTSSDYFTVTGSSAGSATAGTCFRAKDVGANAYTYWWLKAGVATYQTTSCSGTGTTTITFE